MKKTETRSSGFGQPQLNLLKHNGLPNGSGGILIMAVCKSQKLVINSFRKTEKDWAIAL